MMKRSNYTILSRYKNGSGYKRVKRGALLLLAGELPVKEQMQKPRKRRREYEGFTH